MPSTRTSSSRRVPVTKFQPLPPAEAEQEECDSNDLDVDWLWPSKHMDVTLATSVLGGGSFIVLRSEALEFMPQTQVEEELRDSEERTIVEFLQEATGLSSVSSFEAIVDDGGCLMQ